MGGGSLRGEMARLRRSLDRIALCSKSGGKKRANWAPKGGKKKRRKICEWTTNAPKGVWRVKKKKNYASVLKSGINDRAIFSGVMQGKRRQGGKKKKKKKKTKLGRGGKPLTERKIVGILDPKV